MYTHTHVYACMCTDRQIHVCVCLCVCVCVYVCVCACVCVLYKCSLVNKINVTRTANILVLSNTLIKYTPTLDAWTVYIQLHLQTRQNPYHSLYTWVVTTSACLSTNGSQQPGWLINILQWHNASQAYRSAELWLAPCNATHMICTWYYFMVKVQICTYINSIYDTKALGR